MEGVQGANKPQVAVQPYLSTRQYSTLGAVAAVVFSLTAVAFAAIAHRAGLSSVATAIVAAGGGLLATGLASLLCGAAMSKRKSLLEQFSHSIHNNKTGFFGFMQRDQSNAHFAGNDFSHRRARTEDELSAVIDAYANRRATQDHPIYISTNHFEEIRAVAAAVIGASMANSHVVILGIDKERVCGQLHDIFAEPAVKEAKTKEELARALAQGIEQ